MGCMQSGKSNSFVDRRFGERSEGMTAEEKAIARFQRVRQAQVKKSGRFNLEEEGADEQLTHHGQSLSNIDSFADGGPSDDDELPSHAARELDAMQVRQLHFGGGDDKVGDLSLRRPAVAPLPVPVSAYKYIWSEWGAVWMDGLRWQRCLHGGVCLCTYGQCSAVQCV